MPVVIKLKGLPWATNSGDIKSFFRGSRLAEHDIHLAPNEEGKACGIGFACFHDDEDARKAMQKNGAYLGKRYVELFLSSQTEMEKALRDGIPSSSLERSGASRTKTKRERSPEKGSGSHSRERRRDRSRERSRSPRDRSRKSDYSSSRSQSSYDEKKSFGSSGRGYTARGGRGRGGLRGNTFRGRGVSTRGGDSSRGSFSFSSRGQYRGRGTRGQFRSSSGFRGRGRGFGSPNKTAPQPETGSGVESSLFLKISGLPYTALNADIISFFHGVNFAAVHIIPNKSGPHAGKSSGSAFLECATQADCVKALQKHGQYLGNRYLNVFRSSFDEIVNALDIDLNLLNNQHPNDGNPSSLDDPSSGKHRSSAFPSSANADDDDIQNPAISLVAASANINLGDIKDRCVVGIRNLPTVTTSDEILKLFRHFRAIPDSVRIHYLDVNQCSGDAMITLVNNEEAKRAIREISGKRLGSKKIELFLL